MSDSRILVTGGAGYVGSHFALHASRSGYRPVILDNLSVGHAAAAKDTPFIQTDLRDGGGLREHLLGNRYDAIFHFAGAALVAESVRNPAWHYDNNFLATYNLLEAMRASGHDRVIFSSSCAVYGIPESVPIREDHSRNPISPYGRTKLMIEDLLEDYQRAYGLRSASLRYFNAAGCEPDAGLGEDHRPETHMIPNAVKYALGITDELVLFGDDYPTPDGTCVRDYIHVTDLAEAHFKAMSLLSSMPLIRLNLGTGSGFSNRQIVDAVSRSLGKRITPEIGPRRAGDPPELTADPSRAFTELDWKPVRSGLDEIVADVIQWFTEHPKGYGD